ncbi:tyrosine-type recombinase/integrase, partial [Ectopseudomonas hydrolytica]|uniref:tyrosine-type recombinase/integrase n=1 Tax=Ectopseudomonas hydrolytica TaxID=2493633 RepID=UPI003C2BAF96
NAWRVSWRSESPFTVGFRAYVGFWFHCSPNPKLCPVQAYVDWISVAGIARGPVFRSIDRWGHLGEEGLHPNSVVPLLRAVLQAAGLPGELYSSHSLRRGFATWATRNSWDLKALMQYVGWSDGQSALRYVESVGVFPGQLSTPQLILSAENPELDGPAVRT